jgi:hypothetical protein
VAAEFVEINGYRTRVADEGEGAAVVLIHGSDLNKNCVAGRSRFG